MIRVITNNLGSGDWVVIKNNDETLFEGHRVSTFDLVMILQNIGIHTELAEIDDEQMEEGAY